MKNFSEWKLLFEENELSYIAEQNNGNQDWPPHGVLPLKIGDKGPLKGDWIVKLQEKLKVRQTGIFAEETRKAVIDYQKKNHIKTTGQVGEITWKSLFPGSVNPVENKNSNNSPSTGDQNWPPRGVLPLKIDDKGPLKGDWIVKLQEKLKVRQTGIFAEETRKAVIDYQKKNHIKTTGQVGEITWKSLFPGSVNPVENKKSSNQIKFTHIGIDISHYNEVKNWNKVRQSGVSFVYLRASMGDVRPDIKFTSYLKGCQSAGIPVGAYHFYTFGQKRSLQLNNFTGRAPQLNLPPMLDLEFLSNEVLEYNLNKLYEKGLTHKQHAIKDIIFLLKGIKSKYGKMPIIYCSPDFYKRVIKGVKELDKYKLWISAPSRTWDQIKSEFGNRVIIHQQTFKARIPGINGYVDKNYSPRKFW